MPIYSEKNLYPGVNPHLNSALQAQAAWSSFHSRHLNDLITALDHNLPDGYYIGTALSLIGGDDFYLMAAIIFTPIEGQIIGNHCTRIEVITPAHKPPSALHPDYLEKRAKLVRSGVNLVEIDYLHTQPPLLPQMLNYAAGEKSAQPYNIILSIPPDEAYPDIGVNVHSIGVHHNLPGLKIPITPEVTVNLDLQAIYDQTYSSLRLFSLLCDYAAEPEQFNRYQPRDRQRIRARMAAIATEHGKE